MQKIIVTGGSGKTGARVIRELLEHGYQVMNLDLVPPADAIAPFSQIDMTDFGSYTEDQFFDDMFRVTQYRTDPDMVEALVRRLAYALNELDQAKRPVS